MIRTLKKRIITSAMVIVAIFIFSIATGALALMYQRERGVLESTLSGYLDHDWVSSSNPPTENDFPHFNHPDGLFSVRDSYVPSFVVKVDENQTIELLYENGLSIDSQVISEQASLILTQNKTKGATLNHSLFYGITEQENTKIIVFLSTHQMSSDMKTGIVLAVIFSILGLVFFFAIVNLISNFALRPVEISWEQQKQFVADASHDLKTPLTVILANMSILEGHPDTTISSQKQWVDSTKEEALHMKKMVQSLLDLAKSDTLQTSIVLTDTNLSELTESVLLQLDGIAFEKGILFDSSLVAENLIWPSNSESYIVLLKTLLENAIRYSPNDEPIIISLHAQKSNTITLSVQNKGTPIPEEDIPYIFDRFYRSDKSRSTEGHGLGLAISKNIAEALNGTISCVSNQEEGTIFTIEFGK